MFFRFSMIIFLALFRTYVAQDADDSFYLRETIQIKDAAYIAKYFKDAAQKDFCTSAIITKNKVLTPAHCIKGEGTTKVQDGCDKIYDVTEALKHEKYVNADTSTDIGLVTISGRFEWSKCVMPIGFADTTYNMPVGVHVETYGWRKPEGESKLVLERSSIISYTIDCCLEKYKGGVAVSKDSLCVGSAEVQPCHGGTGGILIYRGVAVGVLSIDSVCMPNGTPGVYTSIGKTRAWLNTVLC